MLRAIVETGTRPPRSCFIDGVQFASGCTFGKGNIEAKPGNNVSAIFVKGERRIRLVVRDDVLRVLDEIPQRIRLRCWARRSSKRLMVNSSSSK
jgi:formylmethanofuran dehydrogenase subunit E